MDEATPEKGVLQVVYESATKTKSVVEESCQPPTSERNVLHEEER